MPCARADIEDVGVRPHLGTQASGISSRRGRLGVEQATEPAMPRLQAVTPECLRSLLLAPVQRPPCGGRCSVFAKSELVLDHELHEARCLEGVRNQERLIRSASCPDFGSLIHCGDFLRIEKVEYLGL